MRIGRTSAGEHWQAYRHTFYAYRAYICWWVLAIIQAHNLCVPVVHLRVSTGKHTGTQFIRTGRTSAGEHWQAYRHTIYSYRAYICRYSVRLDFKGKSKFSEWENHWVYETSKLKPQLNLPYFLYFWTNSTHQQPGKNLACTLTHVSIFWNANWTSLASWYLVFHHYTRNVYRFMHHSWQNRVNKESLLRSHKLHMSPRAPHRSKDS
jgi:hypothetical protein